MKNVQYTDQSVNALTLRIVEQASDPASFSLLEEQIISLGDFSVHAGIIGASHFLNMSWKNWSMSEVLACIDWQADSVSSAYLGPLQGILGCGINLQFTNGFRYSIEASISNLDDAAVYIGNLEREISMVTESNRLGLAFTFPSVLSNPIHKPKTLIYAELKSNDLCVKTVHSYPNEGKAALTKTTFKFPSDPSEAQHEN